MTTGRTERRRRAARCATAYPRQVNSEDNGAGSGTSEPPDPLFEPAAQTSEDIEIRAEAAEILSAAPALLKWLLIYSLLRIALVIALAAALSLVMPLIVALLFAVVLALPLSFVIFAGARRRVNAAVAASTARRRSERERLRSALKGDDR